MTGFARPLSFTIFWGETHRCGGSSPPASQNGDQPGAAQQQRSGPKRPGAGVKRRIEVPTDERLPMPGALLTRQYKGR